MTPTTDRRKSSVRGWLVAGAVLVVLAIVVAPTRGSDVALDPRSPGPTGTAAMFAVAEETGATVTIVDEIPGVDDDVTAVVLHDRMSPDDRQALRTWVEDGGRLVLLDPFSELNPAEVEPELTTRLMVSEEGRPDCALLGGFVEEVVSVQWTPMRAPADATHRCFPVAEDGHALVVAPVGDGEVVVTSVVDALVNRELDTAHHGRLAMALLAPEGTGRVHVLWGSRLASGDIPLLSLVPDGAAAAFWALVAATVLFAWSRSRRLGRPVKERLPVRVPGSELALAIGELLERHGHRDAAAARLRSDLRDELGHALSLPVDTPADVLAEVAAARLPGIDAEGLHGILADRPVPDDATLARLAGAMARIRQQLHARTEAGAPGRATMRRH